ncbi:MAG: hypothetical protein WKF84_14215 [Pyrinomonadaceae bacterium]
MLANRSKPSLAPELLASLKPKHWQYLRADNGDVPKEPTALGRDPINGAAR